MGRTFKDQSARSSFAAKSLDPYDTEIDDMASEQKRPRRHEMVDFSDLYLNYDEEVRQERGLDW